MNPDEVQETSERDQLWASLRALRPKIKRLASGEFDSSERQQKIILLLSRIVAAELDFRLQDTAPE